MKEVVVEATKSRIEITLDTTLPWTEKYLDQSSDEFMSLESLVFSLIDAAFGDGNTPEYTFVPKSGTNGVTINLTLTVTAAENQSVPETSSAVPETIQTETSARTASRFLSQRNLNLNLDTVLDNLATAVEESEVFEAIG